jgi:TctA family transporter
MFIPGETSQGVGGALGTLAGIGASFIPGLGPGIAAAMPAIGGSIGSMF